MNLLPLLVGLFAVDPAAGTLQLQDGRRLAGRVEAVGANDLTFTAAGKTETIPFRAITELRVNEKAKKAEQPVEARLRDGSLFRARDCRSEKGRLSFEAFTAVLPEIKLADLASIRFRTRAKEADVAWQEFLKEKSTLDRLIVRRKTEDEFEAAETQAPVGFALDAVEGTVRDITATHIAFDSEGDSLRVKRERVEGIIFATAEPSAGREPIGYAYDIDDDRFALVSLTLAGESWRAVLASGAEASIPAARVRRIDFESANVRYLGDCAIEAAQWTPRFEFPGSALPIKKFMTPRFDQTPDGSAAIDGTTFDRCVWMPAKSVVTLAIPAGFAEFRALAGVEDRLALSDGAQLTIEIDSRIVFDRTIGLAGARSAAITLPIEGGKRMRITVAHAGDSFQGDQLILGAARFAK